FFSVHKELDIGDNARGEISVSGDGNGICTQKDGVFGRREQRHADTLNKYLDDGRLHRRARAIEGNHVETVATRGRIAGPGTEGRSGAGTEEYSAAIEINARGRGVGKIRINRDVNWNRVAHREHHPIRRRDDGEAANALDVKNDVAHG